MYSTATPTPLLDLSLISVLVYTASYGVRRVLIKLHASADPRAQGYPTYLSLLLLALYLKSKSSTVLNGLSILSTFLPPC